KPGVGKTKLVKTFAKLSGLDFEIINLGGMHDSTMLKGSDSVWARASPSLLIQFLAKFKSSNVIILLDEIDKISDTEKGLEVQHALLHLLDPTQNNTYQDLYLNDFSHDLSNIWFIPTMNDDTCLSQPL